jgi:hypothetical protein
VTLLPAHPIVQLFLSLAFQFFKHFENKSRWPICYVAIQRQCDGSSFQNLFPTRTQVNSTADVIFNSAIAGVADTYTQCDQLFIFSGKRTIR